MIKLFSFGPAFGLPDPSPFVTKINLYMKMTGVEFESISDVGNLRKAPKAKLPYIDDEGEIIADSVFIIDHLKRKHVADLDDWLDERQAASAQLLGKSLDENLYWTVVHSRWIKDDVWPTIEKQFFSSLPFPANKLVAKMARSATKKQIMGHGMGKHSDEEVHEIATRNLNSLSILLEDKPYFFGEQPCTFDVTAFAMVSSLTLSTLETELNHTARQFKNLVSFTQRIAEQYYPEL